MGKKAYIDESLPFNKFLTNNPDMTVALIAHLTGIDYFPIYHLRQGRKPSLSTAVAVVDIAGGKLSCKDLLPKKDREKLEGKIQEMKNKFPLKCA